MILQNKTTGAYVELDDEKWPMLRSLGWHKFWHPVKKEMDENMMVSIHKTKKSGKKKNEPVEEPIEIKMESDTVKEKSRKEKEGDK